ncbi:MAG: sterol desaturase family protein [Saprospiraceae bacterium]
MEKYLEIIQNSYTSYFWYLVKEPFNFHAHNYIYWLLAVSLFFFGLEWVKPWRTDQPKFRKDFWLDFFYMFFNFFLFSLVVFSAASNVFSTLFSDFLGLFGITNMVAVSIGSLPYWGQILILFLVGDFLSWNVHRLLHRIPFLWEFHKLHHSVEEMGFAAHLRYHWMENVVYSSLKYIPLAMIGFSIQDLFVLHIFNLVVGHYNHSNITVSGRITGAILGALIGFAIITSYEMTVLMNVLIIGGTTTLTSLVVGPFMKIIFNSPEMHIWHHAHDLPKERMTGVNFGITLAVWDYIFKTDYIPSSGQNIKLGFENLEQYPKTFWEQLTYGFGKK